MIFAQYLTFPVIKLPNNIYDHLKSSSLRPARDFKVCKLVEMKIRVSERRLYYTDKNKDLKQME